MTDLSCELSAELKNHLQGGAGAAMEIHKEVNHVSEIEFFEMGGKLVMVAVINNRRVLVYQSICKGYINSENERFRFKIVES